MTKVIYTFIRYALTAAGASEAVVTDDTVMQFASAVVSIACALWGLYESRKHASLAAEANSDEGGDSSGGLSAVLPLLGLCAGIAFFGVGCTTTCTSADGSTVSQKRVDWTLVDFAVQKSVKYTVAAVLANNPDCARAVATINTGLGSLLTGTPTEAGLVASIKAMETGLDDASVVSIAGALKDACDLYFARSGQSALLSSDQTVQGLVKAVSDGIAEGIALHNAASITA
jgi:hypothetical protein